MPKLKTKKGIRKRFRITKSGKIKHGKAGKGHLLSCKEEERKRKLKHSGLVANPQERRMIKRMLPYG